MRGSENMKEVLIAENDAGQRLDRFLFKAFPDLKKSMLYKGLRKKKIKVNRKRAEASQILNAGDQILLFLPDDALTSRTDLKTADAAEKIENTARSSEKTDLKIRPVFENEDLLVLFKPAGLLSQKEKAQDTHTVQDQIIDYLIRTDQYNPKKELSFTPSAVSRLDRNTEGLCAAGKNASALRELNEAVRNHTLKKYYLARVKGVPADAEIRVWLKKEGTKAVISRTEKDGYFPADMNIRLLKTNGDESLIEVLLLTGRFHQIRSTMSWLGYPLVGDHKYGYAGKVKTQCLAAYRLDFSQTPFRDQIKEVQLNPDDFAWTRI